MSNYLRIVRLVVASPSDVQSERDLVTSVVDEINNTGIAVDLKLHIQVLRWDTDAYPGFHSEGPQGLIDPILAIPHSDFVIGIFWKRFGTPTSNGLTGTAHELEQAVQAWRRNKSPQVMVYFKQQPHTPQSSEETDQWGQVLNFRNRFPEDGLWWKYGTAADFERLLRKHLTQAVRARFGNDTPLALEGRRAGSDVTASSGRNSSALSLNRIPSLWHRTLGRESDIGNVAAELQEHRLVTLTGPGGCGKTRVAIEVANRLKNGFRDGVIFVELASLAPADPHNGSLVPSRIAAIAGIREQAKRPPTEVLAEYFADKHLLLVLDNCEHLVGSCAEIAGYLVDRCGELRILATSRSILRAPAELVYQLGSLSVPDRGAGVEQIAQSSAVQMFVERARVRNSGYRLDAGNARSIARLCRALDGLPLAIEVAAASLSVKTEEEMSRRSHDLLTSLLDTAADEFGHWNTLNAALQWSYDLLQPAEASFMRRLAVFDGGWTENAAAAVSAPTSRKTTVARHLRVLSEHSLITSRNVSGVKHFRFLEPVRQFLLGLMKPGEKRQAQGRHARFFLEFSESREPRVLRAEQAKVLDELQAEADNLRAAIRWAVSTHDAELGLRLIGALWRFCEIRGFLREGRERARDVLAIPGAERFPALRSKVLSGVGILAFRQGDIRVAEPIFEESLEIERTLENPAGIANALSDLGKIAKARGDYERADKLYQEGLEIERKLGDRRQIAVALHNLAVLAEGLGDYDKAADLLRQATTLFEEDGNSRESGVSFNHLARIAVVRRHWETAWIFAQRSLTSRNHVSDRRGVAETLRTLSWISIETEDYGAARRTLRESVAATMEVGDNRGFTEALDLCALLELRAGREARCVRWHAAAEAGRQTLGAILTPADTGRRDAQLAAARQTLGAAAYESCWREGLATPLSTAITLAMETAEESAAA